MSIHKHNPYTNGWSTNAGELWRKGSPNDGIVSALSYDNIYKSHDKYRQQALAMFFSCVAFGGILWLGAIENGSLLVGWFMGIPLVLCWTVLISTLLGWNRFRLKQRALDGLADNPEYRFAQSLDGAFSVRVLRTLQPDDLEKRADYWTQIRAIGFDFNWRVRDELLLNGKYSPVEACRFKLEVIDTLASFCREEDFDWPTLPLLNGLREQALLQLVADQELLVTDLSIKLSNTNSSLQEEQAVLEQAQARLSKYYPAS